MRGRALFLALALALASCGRVGDPVPPEVRLPQPVTDLRAVIREGAIQVTWLDPAMRVDRSRLLDLVALHVYRTEDRGLGEPRPALLLAGRIAAWTDLADIQLASPAPAVVQGLRVTLFDRQGLAYGRRYSYVVLAEDSRGRLSVPASRASVFYIASPEPPGEVKAEGANRAVLVTWQAPKRLVDGEDVVYGTITYQVLRALDERSPLAPVTPSAIAATEFMDTNLENGRAYWYAVRALRTFRGTAAESEDSPRVVATPVETTPPAPPANLSAVASAYTVRLTWAASPDTNVGGYVVYRAQGSAPLARVGSTRAPTTQFVDEDLAPGTYRYAVAAYVETLRANESERTNEVTVTVP